MIAEVFTIKEGDTGRSIDAILEDADTGADADLSGCSVQFAMRHAVTGTLRSAAASVVGAPADGRVRYTFASGDVSESGELSCEWVVTASGGAVTRYPSLGSLRVIISPTV